MQTMIATTLSKTRSTSCIRGFHMHKDDWVLVQGEIIDYIYPYSVIAVLGTSHESGPLGYDNREVHLKYLSKLIVSLHVFNPKYTSA